jgi:hypothetical protein
VVLFTFWLACVRGLAGRAFSFPALQSLSISLPLDLLSPKQIKKGCMKLVDCTYKLKCPKPKTQSGSLSVEHMALQENVKGVSVN